MGASGEGDEAEAAGPRVTSARGTGGGGMGRGPGGCKRGCAGWPGGGSAVRGGLVGLGAGCRMVFYT